MYRKTVKQNIIPLLNFYFILTKCFACHAHIVLAVLEGVLNLIQSNLYLIPKV